MIIPFVAWVLLGERIERRILVALPLVCVGVVLISGVLEAGAYGEHPVRGVLFGFLTGVAYAGFILVLRHGSCDLRRPGGPAVRRDRGRRGRRVVAGLARRRRRPRAELARARAGCVMLALTSQVLGWLLITVSLPRLPAALTSVTLTIQPVGSVLLGVICCSARARRVLQLGGVACILGGAAVDRRRGGAR